MEGGDRCKLCLRGRPSLTPRRRCRAKFNLNLRALRIGRRPNTNDHCDIAGCSFVCRKEADSGARLVTQAEAVVDEGGARLTTWLVVETDQGFRDLSVVSASSGDPVRLGLVNLFPNWASYVVVNGFSRCRLYRWAKILR